MKEVQQHVLRSCFVYENISATNMINQYQMYIILFTLILTHLGIQSVCCLFAIEVRPSFYTAHLDLFCLLFLLPPLMFSCLNFSNQLSYICAAAS